MHMLNCGYNGTCVDLSLVSDARGSDGRVISLRSCLVCTGPESSQSLRARPDLHTYIGTCLSPKYISY